jgi:Peptidase A4 family
VFTSRRASALLAAAAACAAVLAGIGAAPAAQASTSGPKVQPAAALHGCPAGTRLYVPRATSLAADGPAAFFPASEGKARAAAAKSPGLREFASRKIDWVTSLDCHVTKFNNGPKARPSKVVRHVSPSDTVQEICLRPATICEPNWSGYQSGLSAGDGEYTASEMDWTVPDAANSGDNSAHVTIWPGIGSGQDGSDKLVQAGTESIQDAHLGGIFTTHTYYAWIEVVPGEAEVEISNITVSPGDQMGVIVDYLPDQDQAQFFVVDLTTDKGGVVTQPVNGISGSQDEWIVERTEVGSDYSQLVDYGTEHVGYAGGQLTSGGFSTGYELSELEPQNTPMTDCHQSQFLATVGPVDSTGQGFDDTWQNYGSQEACADQYPLT